MTEQALESQEDAPVEEDVVDWWDEADSPAFSAQVVTTSQEYVKKRTLSTATEEWLEEVENNLPRRLHREDGFHASELGQYFCGRFSAFKRLMPRVVDSKRFSGKIHFRFQMGRAGHTHWQKNVYGKMRILKGTWSCSRCTYRIKGLMPDHPCPKCGWQVSPKFCSPVPKSSKSRACASVCVWPGGYDERQRDCVLCEKGGHWDFKETRIEIPELGIVGRFDGILLWDDKEWLLEFKTRRPEDFPLYKPYEDHVIQCNVYMRGVGIERGMIVYLNKSTGETTEFHLKPDPKIHELIEHRIDLVNAAVAEGDLPNGICGGPKTQDARACPFVDACFLGYDNIDDLKEHMAATNMPLDPGRRLPIAKG